MASWQSGAPAAPDTRMTKRDYVLIATTLLATQPPEHRQGERLQHEWDVFELAKAFAAANPERFDKAVFLKACGYPNCLDQLEGRVRRKAGKR